MAEVSRRAFMKIAGLSLAMAAVNRGELPVTIPTAIAEVSGDAYARGAVAVLDVDGRVVSEWADVSFRFDHTGYLVVEDVVQFSSVTPSVIESVFVFTSIGWWNVPLTNPKTVCPGDKVRLVN